MVEEEGRGGGGRGGILKFRNALALHSSGNNEAGLAQCE